MKKLIVIIAALVSFSSCGLFQAYSYRVQTLDKLDYKHMPRFYYGSDIRYNIGDTVSVDGFKCKVIDARY